MLIASPRPLDGEAAQAWLVRACEANGLMPAQFSAWSLKQLQAGHSCPALSVALDCLRRGLDTRHLRRACPLCIRGGEPVLAAWQRLPIEFCLVHDVRLVGNCTHCGAKLRWCDGVKLACAKCAAEVADMTHHAPVVEASLRRHHGAWFNLSPDQCLRERGPSPASMTDAELDAAAGRLQRVLGATRLHLSLNRARKALEGIGQNGKSPYWESVDHSLASDDDIVATLRKDALKQQAGLKLIKTRSAAFPTGWRYLDSRVLV